MEEKDLILQFQKLIDTLDFKEGPIREKIKKEITRIKKFQQSLLGLKQVVDINEVDIKSYAKFIMKEGEAEERRELLSNLSINILLKDKTVSIPEK